MPFRQLVHVNAAGSRSIGRFRVRRPTGRCIARRPQARWACVRTKAVAMIGCTTLAITGLSTNASDVTHPIVMAFERFARENVLATSRLSSVDAGRILIGELGCTACHAGPPALKAKRGPDLSGVGNRVFSDWMRRFLTDPQSVAPGTTMPHVLAAIDENDRQAIASALTAHLSGLQKPVPLPQPGGLNPMPANVHDQGDAARGILLYQRVGCVACHEPLEPDTVGRAPDPLSDLDPEDLVEAGIPLPEPPFASNPIRQPATKYSRRSLTEFLLVPLHARPSGRMPDMKLKAAEAADIAAALLAHDPSPAPSGGEAQQRSSAASTSLAAEGAAAFTRYRCGACHQSAAVPDAVLQASIERLPDLASLETARNSSCIAERPVPQDDGLVVPWYPLDQNQRQSILDALAAIRQAAGDENHPEGDPLAISAVDASLLRLGCVACHERNGRGGVGTDRRPFFETVDRVDLGDEGRLPPRLTAVGERLRKDWLSKAVAGSVSLRPFMHARMPLFPKDAIDGLAESLARADRTRVVPDGVTTATDVPETVPRAQLIAAGALLLDLGCIQCHPLGSRSLPGTLGVNLENATRRVEFAWFRRLLLDPMTVRPGTKMPAFFGETINHSILHGHAESQVAAIWAYLDQDVLDPIPARLIAAAGDFELLPKDRPIVMRTFMKRAGTHAIAVGHPQGVHFAFDADLCRPAEAWRGRFLDARSTWILAKSAPPADPLGEDLIVFDDGTTPAVLDALSSESDWPASPAVATFLGYSLDQTGVPTFRYRVGDLTLEERILPLLENRAEAEPANDHPLATGLIRRISLVPPLQQGRSTEAWLSVLAGESIEVDGDTARRTGEPPLVVTLASGASGSPPPVAILRRGVGNTTRRTWTVALPKDGSPLEVRYRW